MCFCGRWKSKIGTEKGMRVYVIVGRCGVLRGSRSRRLDEGVRVKVARSFFEFSRWTYAYVNDSAMCACVSLDSEKRPFSLVCGAFFVFHRVGATERLFFVVSVGRSFADWLIRRCPPPIIVGPTTSCEVADSFMIFGIDLIFGRNRCPPLSVRQLCRIKTKWRGSQLGSPIHSWNIGASGFAFW